MEYSINEFRYDDPHVSLSQLVKYSKRDCTGMPKYSLAILGDCATQHLSVALKGWAFTKNLALEVFEADYDQILPQVMNSDSEMYAAKPDAVLLYMCVEKLHSEWCKTPQSVRAVFAETTLDRIRECWGYITENCKANILQFTFVEYDDAVFGGYANKQQSSFIYQLKKLNLLLMDDGARRKNVFFIDLCGVQSRLGREKLFDPRLYYIAKMPISLTALPLVAAYVVDVIQALRGNIKKCAVLDLDNTLWGGVIGDDGLSDIQIGELGIGRAFSALQAWFKELKKRGILLAVCSKNNETTAIQPFEKHGEMVLRLDDFSIFVANWDDKATNIRHIQQTLNISMDSMVFIDDNPYERELVRSLIPDITVPDLPEDPTAYLSFLQGMNLFETASFSMEDTDRTDQYHAEAQRKSMRQRYVSYEEYLQSLEMVAVAAPFDAFHTPRIAQLTQRSNQFNLRTVRYTEAEIKTAAVDPSLITIYFTLRDNVADYGLIGVVILEKRARRDVFINTWVMSCRVLKRGMEEFIINKIIDTAKQYDCLTITGEYIKTAKNAIVADIYERMGFVCVGGNFFIMDINRFEYKKSYIKEQ